MQAPGSQSIDGNDQIRLEALCYAKDNFTGFYPGQPQNSRRDSTDVSEPGADFVRMHGFNVPGYVKGFHHAGTKGESGVTFQLPSPTTRMVASSARCRRRCNCLHTTAARRSSSSLFLSRKPGASIVMLCPVTCQFLGGFGSHNFN